jgi:hypothetical protein
MHGPDEFNSAKRVTALPATQSPPVPLQLPRSTTTSPAFPLMVTAFPVATRIETSAPGADDNVIDLVTVVGS